MRATSSRSKLANADLSSWRPISTSSNAAVRRKAPRVESTAASRVTPLRDVNAEAIRLPPSNLEAEQALLGAIFRNNLAHSRVSDFLEPEHFSNAVHARIYAAIGKLIERGQLANPVTLKNLFDQDGALAEIGGAQYLTRLAESAVTVINAEEYGRRIHDLHLRRQLITLGEDVANDAYRHDLDDDPVSQIERFSQRLLDIKAKAAPAAAPTLIGTLPVSAWLEREIADPDFVLGEVFSTTTRIMLVASTGLGKTNLALAMAFAMAAGRGFLHWRGAGRPMRVLYVDGEMSRRLVKARVADAVRREGGVVPAMLYLVCRDDIEHMPPLNAP